MDMLKYGNKNVSTFLLTSCTCRVSEGGYHLPHWEGEGSGLLKILRNCLFPTRQGCFGAYCLWTVAYYRGYGRKLFFIIASKANMASCVMSFSIRQCNSILRTKTHLKRV